MNIDSVTCTPVLSEESAYEAARDFLGQRYVYTVVSPRAHGLSIGVNMNPDARCNFNCVYCEVDRTAPRGSGELDLELMGYELQQTLRFVRSEMLHEHPLYGRLPDEFTQLQHVALSGDGEPTLCEKFSEAVEAVVHVRAVNPKFFKLVLITNATGLDREEVSKGLRYFTSRDEVWVKLDAGTSEYARKVNDNQVELDKVLENILQLARRRPVVVQSLFPALNGEGPSEDEVDSYVQRLSALKAGGAQIRLVQIYSATRPTEHSECGHLPLRQLKEIARKVREKSGLFAQVF